MEAIVESNSRAIQALVDRIADTILDGAILKPWILKVLLIGSYSNLNFPTIEQNGIR